MSARYDLDKVKLGRVMEDPEAAAIIEEALPGLQAHPMYRVAKTLTASAALKLAATQIPQDVANDVRERVAALPA